MFNDFNFENIFGQANDPKKYGVCAAPSQVAKTMLGDIKSGEGKHNFINVGYGVMECTKCHIIQAEIK